MKSGSGMPWWQNRKLCFNRYVNNLKSNDILQSEDGMWEVAFLIKKSRTPRYAVYRRGYRVFPIYRGSTTNKQEIIDYLTEQNENSGEYMSHFNLKYIENGAVKYTGKQKFSDLDDDAE